MAKSKTRRVRFRSPRRSNTRRVMKRRQPTPYPAMVRSEYTSVSESFHNGIGRRNTVIIKNGGPAFKRVELVGPTNTRRSQTRRLSLAERQHILQGRFVPGLWRNCRI